MYVDHSDLSKKSHVEDFPQNFPQLFQELTKEPDTEGRWDSFTVEIILKSKRIENEVKEFRKYLLLFLKFLKRE